MTTTYDPVSTRSADWPLESSAGVPAAVHVTWSFVAGGSETYALTVASGIDRTRYRPVLCAIDQGGPLESEARTAGIETVVMGRRPGLDFRLMARMYDLFRSVGAKVVHTHHFNQLFYSVIAARAAGARVVHTEHSVAYFGKWRLRAALRLLSVLCDRVVAIGADGERVLREEVGIPAGKLIAIEAGVDPGAFVYEKQRARQELGLAPAARVALIVARLSPEKNHRLLLDAFRRVLMECPGGMLLIAGEGPEREAIDMRVREHGLEGNVRILGVRRDVAKLLAACDVFVLPSEREGLPIAVLEAMAASRPVIAASVGDLPRLVLNGETGLLVEPGDEIGLARALTDLLKDASRARAMGNLARKAAERDHCLETTVNRHQLLYDLIRG